MIMAKKSRLGRPTPVRMKTRARGRISNKSYREGIREMMQKGYVPGEAKKVLRGSGLGLRSRRSVSKSQFLHAVDELEDAQLIKHKSGRAKKVFKSAASWEAWDDFREENVKKRTKAYSREERAKADAAEREAEKKQQAVLSRKERLAEQQKKQEDMVRFRLSRAAAGSDEGSLAAGLSSMRGEKNKLLSRIRSGGNQPAEAPGSGWNAPPQGPSSPPSSAPPSAPFRPL